MQIASSTRFDFASMAGSWQVVQRFGNSGDPGSISGETFTFDSNGGAPIIQNLYVSCQNSDCAQQEVVAPAIMTGPGRIRTKWRAKTEEFWVLWVDEGFRTAVVGTPSGAFGWIMEKNMGPTPPDRLNAAREVLSFNGYDTSKLVNVVR